MLQLLLHCGHGLVENSLDFGRNAELGNAPLHQLHHQNRRLWVSLRHWRNLRHKRAHALQELHCGVALGRPVQRGHRIGLDVDAVLGHLLVFEECDRLRDVRCVGCALDVGATNHRLRLEVLANDLCLDAQGVANPLSDVELLQLHASRAKLSFDLLCCGRLRRLGAAAHHVGHAQHLVNLHDLVLAVLTQLVDAVDHLVDRCEIDLALDATGLCEHCPVVHGHKLVLSGLREHAANRIAGRLVVHASHFGRTGQPGNAGVDFVQLVELVLRHDVVGAGHEVAGRDVGDQWLGAWEEIFQTQGVVFHVQDDFCALGVPVHLAALLAPNLKHLALVPRVVLWVLVADVALGAGALQGHDPGNLFTKALDQLVLGHVNAARYPAHLRPCACW